MEDLKYIEKVFDGFIILFSIMLLIAAFGTLDGIIKGNITILPLLGIIALWFIIYTILSVGKIIYTRFVAMSENILEITQILEEKLNKEELNSNNN